MGAISQIVGQKTTVAGVADQKAKITPQANQILSEVQNDLELCQTTKTNEPQLVKVEKDNVKIEFKKFDLKIFGANCPIEITASLNATQQSDDQLQAQFLMKVVMKSEAYIEKYKMKFMEVTGNIRAQAEKTGTTVSLPAHMDIAANGESTELGVFTQSLAYDMTVGVDLSQFSFNMLVEQNATLKYGDVNQKAYSKTKMNGFTQPELTFNINDKAVSKSEYEIFLQSFAFPAVISNDDSNAPDSKVPTQCQIVAYEANQISPEVLKQQLTAGTLQTAGRLMMNQSCMKDASLPFQNTSAQLTYGAEWISLTLPPTSATEQSAGLYDLYGDQAAQTSEQNGILLGLQCKVVPSCP